jgi:hypothetical protein
MSLSQQLSHTHHTHNLYVFAKARRRRRDAAAVALESAYQRLQLYARGAELLASDAAALAAVERHLVRGLGADAVDLLLRHQQVLPFPLAHSHDLACLSRERERERERERVCV